MTRDLEKDKCEILGRIKNLQLVTSTFVPDLSPETIARREEVLREREDDPRFFDGDKLGVEAIDIVDGYARIYVVPRTYSQVIASRDVRYDQTPPIDWMYSKLGNRRSGQLFVKRNPHMVNPLTQGVLLALNPDGNRTDIGDLPVLINIRGGGVDHGEGLRHHLAGYADLGKSFEDFNFDMFNALRSIGQELYEEAALTPEDMVNVVPFAIVQDPFEPQIHYLAITRLGEKSLREKLKRARDKYETRRYEFIPIRELKAYGLAHEFYSHSRPLFRECLADIVEGFEMMRRVE